MKLITRKSWRARPKAQTVNIQQNWCGQGGEPKIVLQLEDGSYLTLEPETDADARLLMSHAHIVFNNFNDKQEREREVRNSLDR